MSTKELIVSVIKEAHPEATVEPTSLAGDDHWFVLVVSESFEGTRTFQRQRPIMAMLHPHFESGRIHALDLKCLTPGEVQTQGKPTPFRPH